MADSYFVKIFGGSPVVKVLDFLLTFREYDYSLTEISVNSEVAWSTIHHIIPSLKEQRIVIETRTIGRATLYKLNTKNPIVQKLIETEAEIIKQSGKTAAEQISQKVAVKSKNK